VKTYRILIATVLQGCLIFVLSAQPASSQGNPTRAQDANAPVSSAGEQATPPPSQEPTAPGPNQPVKLVPRSAETRARTYLAEHHVILNVFVTDPSGAPVPGLKQEDFTLLDHQQPETIASFKAVTGSTAFTPPRVFLVLDSVNNPSGTLIHARSELETFLGQNQGNLPYPVSIVRLTDYGMIAGQPSRDGHALISELRRLPYDVHVKVKGQEHPPNAATMGQTFDPTKSVITANPEGADLSQRFILSIPALAGLVRDQKDVPGRVILVWIGAGWPLLSGPGFLPDTPELQSNFFAHIVALSTELREAQITLDVVSSPKMLRDAGLLDGYYQAFLPGVPSASEANAANLALPVLAYQSGGQILEDNNDLAAKIDKCVADADTYYVLSFDSIPASGPDEYRPLQVKVNKPGLTVRTNTAYYAQP
jgi:VWFA-related protein